MTRLRAVISGALVVLPLLVLGAVGAGCVPVVGPDILSCDSDNDCASRRCELGRCQARLDDGGQALDDGGARDGGERDDGGALKDGGARVDAGAIDAGFVDGGVLVDAGAGVDAGAQGQDGGVEAGSCQAVCPGAEHRSPIEVCGDGYDNDCDGTVDEQPCGKMRLIRIDPSAALSARYSVQVPVNAQLLGATDGSDVRVWRYHEDGDAGPDGAFLEVPRVLDPDDSWSAPSTLWFPLAEPLPIGSVNEDYRMTWTVLPEDAGPPLDDENEVFHLADYFEWGPSDDGAPNWSIDDNPGGDRDIDVEGGGLVFVAADEGDNRPVATRDFPPFSGAFLFDVRFHWAGTDGNNPERYLWRLLLGNADMGASPWTLDELKPDGVGPNLIWGQGTASFDLPYPYAFGVDGQPDGVSTVENEAITILGDAGVDTSTRVLIGGDTSTQEFFVRFGDTSYGPFFFADPTVSALSRLRVFTAEVTITPGGGGLSPARFDHVILRARASEPAVSLFSPAQCE